jgi:SAM-dependent methyltransferase
MYLLEPYLTPLVYPGCEVLDLCCGSGPMSFWFEDRGARITAIDYAPYMMALARQEANSRHSMVDFIEADIFTYDIGQAHYDLVSCFGNSISDFPLSDFAKLIKKVANSLKPGGRFVLDYLDGSYNYITGNIIREGIYQGAPEQITFRFKEYLPEVGATVNTIFNETRAENYCRRAYIYSVPVVQVAASFTLALEQHIILGENHFLDIFIK